MHRAVFTTTTCILAAACSPGASDSGLPYHTVVDTVRDTIVARTTGDVPDRLLARVLVVWKSTVDASDTTNSIGDVSGMAVAPNGNVFVWDHVTPAIWLVTDGGTSIKRVGRPGSGPGEYDNINGLAARPDGRLVAWDAGNARLNVYESNGTFRTSRKLGWGQRFTSNALTADSQNRIWMRASVRDPNTPAETSTPALFRYDTAGVLIDTVVVPQYSTNDPFLVARSNQGTMEMVVPLGTYSTYTVSPLGYLVGGPGRPYVIDAQLNARPLRIERDLAPVPALAEERAQLRARTEFSLRRMQPNWTWTGPEVPSAKPPYAGLTVGLDGRIWVALSVASEAFEPDPPSATQNNPPPLVKFRAKEKRWDVFEPDGRYVGRVVAPRLFTAYAMRGDEMWGVLRDEDDVPAVVKMRAAFTR